MTSNGAYPGYVVQMIDAGMPAWFSCKVGRDFGSPGGGWSQDPSEALKFHSEHDAKEFIITFLRHQAPFCDVKKA